MVHHCTDVGTLILVLLRYMFDQFTCVSNHFCVLGDLSWYHTHGGDLIVGDLPLSARCAVLLPLSVKQDGRLREEG